ncbi:transposase, partial [Ideonella sp. 4Y11]
FLFPVRALSRVFRGQFMQALRQLATQADAPSDANLSASGRRALYRHDWVVYAKAPMGGPAQVLNYLSRYSHRTAIGNERIRSVSAQEVVFSVRADSHGGQRLAHLATGEFIRRLLLHVLPGGLQRIRHYGVLANGCKKTQLTQARAALQQPAPNPLASESAAAFMARVAQAQIHTCPKCRGPLQVIQVLAGLRRLAAPGADITAPHTQARAPP